MLQDETFVYVILFGSVVLLSLWIHRLWRAVRDLLVRWREARKARRQGREAAPTGLRTPWHRRTSVLFYVCTCLVFAGLVLTIAFHSRTFFPLSLAGILGLSSLFFNRYAKSYTADERRFFRGDPQAGPPRLGNEVPRLYRHPAWVFECPKLLATAQVFIVLGIVLTLVTSDVYMLLLSAFGVIFYLQLWSFHQLNTVTITEQRILVQRRFPKDVSIELTHDQIEEIWLRRTSLQKLAHVGTLVLTRADGPDVEVVLDHPEDVQAVLETLSP